MLRVYLLLVPTLFLFVAPSAFALGEWRTQVQVTNGGNGQTLEFASDGGLNVASSSVQLARGNSAFAEASSTLSPDGFIPALRTRAVNNGTRAQAVAWGVQSYTNTSGAPLNTDLVLNLTADITGANDLRASVYLFEDANFEFSPDGGTILFESSSVLWDGFAPFANNLGPTGFDISRNNTPGPVDETRSFNFTVDPNESFYVWAFLVTTADQPGASDASNTLTTSFTNTVGLTANAMSIPEPTTGLLLASALVAWAGTQRRRV